MKNLKSIFTAFICAVSVCFVGCDDSEDVDASDIIGTWSSTEVVTASYTLDDDPTVITAEYTYYATFTFSEEGEVYGNEVGYVNYENDATSTESYNNTYTGTYSFNGDKWAITITDQENYEKTGYATMSDNTLYVILENSSYSLTRASGLE